MRNIKMYYLGRRKIVLDRKLKLFKEMNIGNCIKNKWIFFYILIVLKDIKLFEGKKNSNEMVFIGFVRV